MEKITKSYLHSKDWAYDENESSSDEEEVPVRSRPTKITIHTTSDLREVGDSVTSVVEEPIDSMSVTESAPSSPVREKSTAPSPPKSYAGAADPLTTILQAVPSQVLEDNYDQLSKKHPNVFPPTEPASQPIAKSSGPANTMPVKVSQGSLIIGNSEISLPSSPPGTNPHAVSKGISLIDKDDLRLGSTSLFWYLQHSV